MEMRISVVTGLSLLDILNASRKRTFNHVENAHQLVVNGKSINSGTQVYFWGAGISADPSEETWHDEQIWEGTQRMYIGEIQTARINEWSCKFVSEGKWHGYKCSWRCRWIIPSTHHLDQRWMIIDMAEDFEGVESDYFRKYQKELFKGDDPLEALLFAKKKTVLKIEAENVWNGFLTEQSDYFIRSQRTNFSPIFEKCLIQAARAVRSLRALRSQIFDGNMTKEGEVEMWLAGKHLLRASQLARIFRHLGLVDLTIE